jgi:hypothetical protein
MFLVSLQKEVPALTAPYMRTRAAGDSAAIPSQGRAAVAPAAAEANIKHQIEGMLIAVNQAAGSLGERENLRHMCGVIKGGAFTLPSHKPCSQAPPVKVGWI